MAIRWRRNGKMECAAITKLRTTDTYINDRLHYQLTNVLGVLVPIKNGQLWRWRIPKETRVPFTKQEK